MARLVVEKQHMAAQLLIRHTLLLLPPPYPLKTYICIHNIIDSFQPLWYYNIFRTLNELCLRNKILFGRKWLADHLDTDSCVSCVESEARLGRGRI